MNDEIRWPGTLNEAPHQPILQGGIKYRLTYRLGLQKRDREAVMTFIGINVNHEKVTSFWSARPLAGTQELPVESISKIEVADPRSQVYLNRIVK